MIVKFIFIITLLSVIKGLNTFRRTYSPCGIPTFAHGKTRIRANGQFIRFTCQVQYQLVGNKYATCRNRRWDVPIPVCVKSGCDIPQVENSVMMSLHNDAWVVYFCLPGYERIGDYVLYCDGRRWNGTAPRCTNTSKSPMTSCDFEDEDICGWTQDDFHDFDWKRWNKKTPSAFLFTGPTFDHTYGPLGTGYYMYIETSSREENDTARLLSPVYDMSLAKDGCFSFFYHMFGRSTGGLRIYQKPDSIELKTMLNLNENERMKYVLFEKWGNQGNLWYRGAALLVDFEDNFQIVIEGIRGFSFTSDIAIDDVAILQGNNCSIALNSSMTPPTYLQETCSNRCILFGDSQPNESCGCSYTCIAEGTCCPDFFDLCSFYDAPTVTTEIENAPQTQKLVASTKLETTRISIDSPISASTTTSSTTTMLLNTIKSFVGSTKSTVLQKTATTENKIITLNATEKVTNVINANKIEEPTTKSKNTKIETTKNQTVSDIPKVIIANTTTTSNKLAKTVSVKITQAETTKIVPTVKSTTKYINTVTTITTTEKGTTQKPKSNNTDVKKIEIMHTVKATPVTLTTVLPKKKINGYNATRNFNTKNTAIAKKQSAEETTSHSNGFKTGIIVAVILVCCVVGLVVGIKARGARGRLFLDRIRGHMQQDTEVRYLHVDCDD